MNNQDILHIPHEEQLCYTASPTTADEDNIQIVLSQDAIQTYLMQKRRKSSCWGRLLPVPFERASKRSWLDPKFDSDILEEQYKASAYPQHRLRFRYALFYILLISISWFIYFMTISFRIEKFHWPIICTVLPGVVIAVISLAFLTYTDLYKRFALSMAIFVAVFLCIFSLSLIFLLPKTTPSLYLSPAGHFSICIEILLLIYTLIPLPLYMCITTGIVYSTSFELLTGYVNYGGNYDALSIFVRFLAHVCIQLIGIHIFVMMNVRMRGTFMKVGQSLLVRRQLESEKKLKENMIHSLMPPKVANWLLNDDDNFTRSGMEPKNSNPSAEKYIQSLFRPFNMNRMENVSILFADIVGFTKMSSTKSAEQLVDILNDLFRRFDQLCKLHNCEKISTLGDCYYCVSGCPEPRPDHAKCCVEMGLGMIQAIKQFDQQRNEDVNMRVGVHTGTVLCGIVGTRRFKFDVWSNDVTLANRMESTGKPGMVHISEKTYDFLQNLYLVEEHEPVFGYKTYFILGRKINRRHTSDYGMFRSSQDGASPACNSLQFFVSSPTTPPAVSPQPQSRPRTPSYDTSHSLLKPTYNPNRLSPDIAKGKASSLPSILDSENDATATDDSAAGAKVSKTEENSKAPSPSQNKYSAKLKNWKIPKFLKKADYKQGVINDVQISNNYGTGSTVGYQQVPTIIETTKTTPSNDSSSNYTTKLEVPLQDSDNGSGEDSKVDGCWLPSNTLYLEETKEETMDIKSYISQSRSDVGQYDYSPNEFSQFIRTGSYRSHYDKSPKENLGSFLDRTGSNRSHRGRSYSPNTEIVPLERARSATTGGQLERTNKNSLEVPSQLTGLTIDDEISVAQSVNSRKDSGIRSTSRHSSIHQQVVDNPILMVKVILESDLESDKTFPDIFETGTIPQGDLFQHRVSGYYTSSQSSVNSPDYTTSAARIPTPLCQKFGCNFQNLRKQSDKQLIKCVQDNSQSKSSYFMKPPLSQLTLFFQDRKMENEYRRNVHTIYDQSNDSMPTLATSRFNTYLDILISAIVFAAVSTSLFALYKPTSFWISSFVVFAGVHICAFCLCIRKLYLLSDRVFKCCSNWYRWNTFGAVLVSIPVISVLTNFLCVHAIFTAKVSHYLYIYMLFVGIVHFCNFTQLNFWMKNILATIFTSLFLMLNFGNSCGSKNDLPRNYTHLHNISLPVNTTNPYFSKSSPANQDVWFYDYELVVDALLLLMLVWFLNREFEISYRLSFHSNFVANRDKKHVESMKNQADWLINNIVPEHVAEQLKKDAKYCENFKDVGIIFASIVNFNEMYDESYCGGKEFLRVLNELIGDFDELLKHPEFRSVEKIKTIGSTFMAASGLNPKTRAEYTDPFHHLYALMDFAIAMQKVIDNFNRDLLEFNLILRVGYNIGDVTAAVIGTTKLYYDIWGDAVNIASRMDSTGVNGRIQIGAHCMEILENKYVFETRGSIYVKGKDHMDVYLLLHKRDHNTRDV